MSTTIDQLQQADAQIRSALANASSSVIEDQITALQPLGEKIIAAPAEPEIAAWLALQEPLIDCAIEGVVEVTAQLAKEQPTLVAQALATLPEQSQLRLKSLLDELANLHPEADLAEVAAVEAAPISWINAHAAGAPIPTGVSGRFIGTSTFESTRGYPVKSGTMEIVADDGKTHQFPVNTGGGATTYTKRNGWLPPGVYRISNYRPNRDTAGMVLDGIGYSFDVDPVDGTALFGRSLFRIHPDGGSAGTNGCLGVRESAAILRECEHLIADLISKHGPFKLAVSYA